MRKGSQHSEEEQHSEERGVNIVRKNGGVNIVRKGEST